MSDSEKNTQPRYKALYEQFARALDRGEYMPGTPFMSLAGLSSRYGVSEITARRVIHDLVDAGYLNCTRGRRPQVAVRSAQMREYHVPVLGRLFHIGDLYERGPWSYHRQQALLLEMLGARLVPQFCETYYDGVESALLTDCDAMLLYSSSLVSDRVWVRKRGKPYLFLDSYSPNTIRENLLSFDYTPGVQAIAQDLLAGGVRSVLSLPVWKPACPDRFDEIYRLLLDSGQVAAADLVVRQLPWDGHNTSAMEVAQQFIREKHPRPIAFLVNDFQAQELGEYCRLRQWRNGSDFRIIGYSGMPESALAHPAVSGLVMPFEAVARRASEYLRNAIEKREPFTVPAQSFPVQFVKRDT